MASQFMKNLKEEVTCPVCLNLMVKPVSADCGHTFCQGCITLYFESIKCDKKVFICPVCRISYQFSNLRPNRNVANIVERLKMFKPSPEEEQKVFNCARHGKKLQLFCRKDMMAICWLCERSQEHRGHKTALIEEVAQEYKNQIQKDVQNVRSEFKRMRDIMDSEEKKELQKLRQEKEDILNNLAESESEHAQQSKLLEDFISDVEHQLQCSDIEILQGVENIIERSHTFSMKKPKAIAREQRKFRAPDLQGMLQVLQGHRGSSLLGVFLPPPWTNFRTHLWTLTSGQEGEIFHPGRSGEEKPGTGFNQPNQPAAPPFLFWLGVWGRN
ncbi:tripartite motif-containing protein 12A isoform X3 [Mus musculus]|uniref:Trim12 protein n=1 Tax=Mus musculus TaxID=10090 RepID=Q504P5_MOUSE|nr:tripartite motif-containing protein 12A isoform 1 [Mus musculus]XP_030098943.1 tripartite motif-containing protein 12A isoform X3 [Mus musculus]AAH94899.1 Trim12 protein [Mus musculus]